MASNSWQILEGVIAKITDSTLASQKVDKTGRLDAELVKIGQALDQFVDQLNMTRQRSKEYDRTPEADPRRVASSWKRVLDVLSGMAS